MTKITRITKQDGRIVKEQIDSPKVVYNVRIRPELYEPLVIQAAQDDRSVTNHINRILEKHLSGK